jgi:hypothetical protein
MARYGKTLSEEIRTSGEAEEDGQRTKAFDKGKWLRRSAASIVLSFSLILFYNGHGITI